MLKQNNTWWLDTLLLALLLGSLFFVMLGNRPLFVPDEGRYAEIAREMATSGDYITPYLNQIKYFEKPALFYWLGAMAIKLGGPTLFAVRSINALLGLLGCLATYFTGRKLYGRTTGLLAALLLGTSSLYFVMVHMVSLDLPVTVFLSCSLYAFLLASQQPPDKRRWYCWTAAAFAALAVLTKGLIGLVFPSLIIGTWLMITGEWRQIRTYYPVSAFVIFIAIAAPWHLLVGWRNPEFFYFYFIEQHFLRYTTKEVGHYQPVWFFIPVLIAGFFPWIVFLPQAIGAAIRNIRNKHHAKSLLFLLLWASLIFLFFSFSKSKLIPYLLPVMPSLALLTAHYLETTTKQLTALFVLIAISGLLLLSVSAALSPLDTRTIRPLANDILRVIKPGDEVITLNQYYQDLPYYLERRVTIVNWKNELTYGMAHQDTSEWMINTATFWQRWNGPRRVFVILSEEEYQALLRQYPKKQFHVLGKTLTNFLISNRPS